MNICVVATPFTTGAVERPWPESKKLTQPVTGFVDLTVAVRVKFVPDGTFKPDVVSVKEVATGPPPPPPSPPPPPPLPLVALPLPQLSIRNNNPPIPRLVARPRFFRPTGENDRNRMANPSATISIHEPGGSIHLPRG